MNTCKVPDSGVQDGYALLQRVSNWLANKGRQQRISETTLAEYESWQAVEANWFVECDSQMAGVYTLIEDTLGTWPADVTDPPSERVWWLRALATDPEFRGRGIGSHAIESALQTLGSGVPLYLDCVSDFLPSYYESQGFRRLASQTQVSVSGKRYDVTLLRHENDW